MKKMPQRTCMGCNEKKDKKDLIRIVRNKEGEVFIDLQGRQNGRGAYLKATLEAVEIARKKNSLGREVSLSLRNVYKSLNKYKVLTVSEEIDKT